MQKDTTPPELYVILSLVPFVLFFILMGCSAQQDVTPASSIATKFVQPTYTIQQLPEKQETASSTLKQSTYPIQKGEKESIVKMLDEAIRCDHSFFHEAKRSDFIQTTANQTLVTECGLVAYKEDACSLSKLPLLGLSESLSKANILNKVVVTDAWMHENFKQFLASVPVEALEVFASITGIVIHPLIDTSFYFPVTGMLYLSPQQLWQTEAQRKQAGSCVIDKRPVFYVSSVDGEAFQWLSLSRYVKSGQLAFDANAQTRSLTQMQYQTAQVVFHEMAYALNQMPIKAVEKVSLFLKPASISQRLETHMLGKAAQALAALYPLGSDYLKQLAMQPLVADRVDVPYRLHFVNEQFLVDKAVDLRSYKDANADTALLFEAYMMKRVYGLDREVAFVSPVNAALAECSDVSFEYKSGGKLANLINRAEFVVNLLMPNFYQQQVLPKPLDYDEPIFSWCQQANAGGLRSAIDQLNPERQTFLQSIRASAK